MMGRVRGWSRTRTEKAALLVPFFSFFLLIALPAHGAGEIPPGRQSFRAYGTDQGLENLAVHGIVQDPEGFLWVGTEDGLYRYDGSRFDHFGLNEGLASASVEVLHVDASGRLFVGTFQGLAWREGDHFVAGGPEQGLPRDQVFGLASDRGGRLWVASRGGLFRERSTLQFEIAPGWPPGEATGVAVSNARSGIWAALGSRVGLFDLVAGRWTFWGAEEGLGPERVEGLFEDGEGRVWARTPASLRSLDRGAARFVDRTEMLGASSTRGYLSPGRRGGFFLPTNAGLVRVEGRTRTFFGAAQGFRPGWSRGAFEDREGSLWVASLGLHRLLGQGVWSSYTKDDGLPNEAIWTFLRDRDGLLWVGTDDGACSGRESGWDELPGTRNHAIRSIVQAPDGALWMGGSPLELFRFDPRTRAFDSYGASTGLMGKRILDLVVDRRGELWVATDGAGLLKATSTRPPVRFERVTLPGGRPAERFGGLLEDRQGRLWAAGEQGLACRTGSEWRRFTTRDGLKRNHVAYVAETRSGEIWAAYFEPVGLERFRFDGGIFRKTGALDAATGLASRKVYLVGEDARGQLWVGTGKGVDVVSNRGSTHYGVGEGLVGEDCDSNAFLAEPDGSVLIGTTSGVSLFNGRVDAVRLEPPRAVLVEARLGRKRVALPPAEMLQVVRGEAILEVRFAGLSFLNEGRVEHQVRLLGLEDAWRPTRVREARYASLPRGEYRFEVRARHAPAGEWGNVAGLAFDVLPAFWETLWFRGLVGLFLVALVAGGVSWRLSTLRQRTNELEALVTKRTSELRNANEALTNLSVTDPLTGLKNRRFLALRIPEDIAAVERAHHGSGNATGPSSLTDLLFVMVDIDHFKDVNDQFGHAAGDHVLEAVGEILMAATRLSDTVVRWGGEEFLVVARQLGRDAASILAERIRLAVGSHPFAIGEGRTIHRTCSVGFAPYPFVSGAPKLLGWEAVVGVADLSLYAAKRSGRNLWVGLSGTARTRQEGLAERLLSEIPAMLRDGELSVSTSAPDPSALQFE